MTFTVTVLNAPSAKLRQRLAMAWRNHCLAERRLTLLVSAPKS